MQRETAAGHPAIRQEAAAGQPAPAPLLGSAREHPLLQRFKPGLERRVLLHQSQPQLGLVAQEVEEVLPELVRTDRAGQKAVSYERLSLVLLEAVKSQQQRMESMERERLGLVEKHAALEARLEALEQGVLARAAD